MSKLLQRIKCFFGYHGKGHWAIEIIDVRYHSHAIDYDQEYRCEYCAKIIAAPIDKQKD